MADDTDPTTPAPAADDQATGLEEAGEPRTFGLRRNGRGLLFRARVRAGVKAELAKSKKLTAKADKDAALLAVTDEMIEEAADHAGVMKAIGDGGIIQWFLDHKEQIMAVIKIILAALGA